MSIEAMKQALEALETCMYPQQKQMQAITSLRQAIEQAEKQEPVAWGMQNDDGRIYDCITPEEHARLEGEYKVPLYTTPQPQREWVGLTDEEMHECWDSPLTPLGMKHARMIEAKLKDKNGL